MVIGYLKMAWACGQRGDLKVSRIMLGLIWTHVWRRWERRLFPRLSEAHMVRAMRHYSLANRKVLLNGRTWRQVVRERRAR